MSLAGGLPVHPNLYLVAALCILLTICFPVRWRDSRHFDAPDEAVREAARRVLRDMQVWWRESVGGTLQARMPANMSSWGERVEAWVQGGVLDCESRCVFGFVDWGKNRKNVTKFLADVSQILMTSDLRPCHSRTPESRPASTV